MWGMIANHAEIWGMLLLIFLICLRPSQTTRDVYDFEFSLVAKIWDGWETVESPIVWDFPDIWKKALRIL